jgi:hypothetical protein
MTYNPKLNLTHNPKLPRPSRGATCNGCEGYVDLNGEYVRNLNVLWHLHCWKNAR